MLDFIPSFISHLFGYFLLRSLFGNQPKITLKHILVYLAISLYFNYYLLYYISELGFGTLLFIWIGPMMIPIFIHLGMIYIPNRRAHLFHANSAAKPTKIAPKIITLLKREKLTLLILGGVAMALIGFVFIMGNGDFIDWVISGVLGLCFFYVAWTYFKLSNITEQKIIVIKGRTRPTVLEYPVDSTFLTFDYGALLNTPVSFVDYVGRVLVKDESSKTLSWHFLFKTPDDAYTNPNLKPSSEHIYLEVASQLNYVYDAKISLWKRDNQLLKLKKNKS